MLNRYFFLLKNTFKEALRYLFNVVILYNTVFYISFGFKLKIDPKTSNFKKLKEIIKTWRKFAKTFCNPEQLKNLSLLTL